MNFALLVPVLNLHDCNQPVPLRLVLSWNLSEPNPFWWWKQWVNGKNGASSKITSMVPPNTTSPIQQSGWLVPWLYWHCHIRDTEETLARDQKGRKDRQQWDHHCHHSGCREQSCILSLWYLWMVGLKWPKVGHEEPLLDGKITEEEVISGFYLMPAYSYKDKNKNEWQLNFAKSKVQLKKCISSSFLQAYQVYKANIIKLFFCPKAISSYQMCTMMLWDCKRLLPTLAQEDYAAHFCWASWWPATLSGQQAVSHYFIPSVQHAGTPVRGDGHALCQAFFYVFRSSRALAHGHRAGQESQPTDAGAPVVGRYHLHPLSAVQLAWWLLAKKLQQLWLRIQGHPSVFTNPFQNW